MYEVTGSSISIHASLSKSTEIHKTSPIPVVGKAIIKSISRKEEMMRKTSIIYIICHRLRNDTQRENIKKTTQAKQNAKPANANQRNPMRQKLTPTLTFILTPVDFAGTSPGSRRCSSSSIHFLPAWGDR